VEFSLHMPKPLSGPHDDHIPNHGVVVIVGANGSGKTRLGSWIDLTSEHKEGAHRVSAQKSLDMPESVNSTSVDDAHSQLLTGNKQGQFHHKMGRRWGSQPIVSLLNDFQSLMIYLFSDEAEASIRYRKDSLASCDRLPPPETRLDIINRIWKSILPNRELEIRSGKVEASSREKPNDPYNAREMSDGERVIFYLIGECLAAPKDGVIVIDEPEIHLHKSIQATLWDAIEAERPDCLFVYLTHDLDFAASRIGAPKICLREFDGKRWDWYVVPDDEHIPEELMLQIVGSRKPILFTEGKKDNLDYFLYSHLYPDFTVVPCGSCTHVINAARAFATLSDLHRLECRGIIDRDHRTASEVAYLAEKGISALEVSEIENLFLHDDVLHHVGLKLEYGEREIAEIIGEVKYKVFARLNEESERVAASAAVRRIEARFTGFDASVRNQQQLEASWKCFVGSVQVQDLYAQELTRIKDILAYQDYTGALRVYDNKGLIYQVSPLFGLKGDGLIGYIKRMIANGDERILVSLRQYVPAIAVN
jgi:hypothetical protein